MDLHTASDLGDSTMRHVWHLKAMISRAAPVWGAMMFLLTAMAGTALAALPPKTPEIDPASLAAAITLFTGGTMYLSSRRRVK